jgi:hypothetical protein
MRSENGGLAASTWGNYWSITTASTAGTPTAHRLTFQGTEGSNGPQMGSALFRPNALSVRCVRP